MILNQLKALLLDNYLIKIASLAFAVVLWLYVNAKGGVEMEMTVPLELKNLPPTLVVVGDMIDDVNVRIKGRERILQRMTGRSVSAVLDLTGAREGDNVYFLDPSVIAVPSNIQITWINPRRVVVRTEALLKKAVQVSARVYGAPAAGFRIGRVDVTPAWVTVEGARSVVDPLTQLLTDPIDVTGIRKVLVRETRLNLLGKNLQADVKEPIQVKIHVIRQN
ncbi:MAG TPA: CdaR family protein [Nitrospiria bacterium]|nr:CdaR family protein [Nitrospiria bacterium]